MLKKYGDQRFKESHLDQPQGRTAERPRLCLAEHRDHFYDNGVNQMGYGAKEASSG
jgi:hypothetical protein